MTTTRIITREIPDGRKVELTMLIMPREAGENFTRAHLPRAFADDMEIQAAEKYMSGPGGECAESLLWLDSPPDKRMKCVVFLFCALHGWMVGIEPRDEHETPPDPLAGIV